MSPEEVEERRKKAGLCPTCGEVQTHRLNMLMNKVPVNIDGLVSNGVCLRCKNKEEARTLDRSISSANNPDIINPSEYNSGQNRSFIAGIKKSITKSRRHAKDSNGGSLRTSTASTTWNNTSLGSDSYHSTENSELEGMITPLYESKGSTTDIYTKESRRRQERRNSKSSSESIDTSSSDSSSARRRRRKKKSKKHKHRSHRKQSERLGRRRSRDEEFYDRNYELEGGDFAAQRNIVPRRIVVNEGLNRRDLMNRDDDVSEITLDCYLTDHGMNPNHHHGMGATAGGGMTPILGGGAPLPTDRMGDIMEEEEYEPDEKYDEVEHQCDGSGNHTSKSKSTNSDSGTKEKTRFETLYERKIAEANAASARKYTPKQASTLQNERNGDNTYGSASKSSESRVGAMKGKANITPEGLFDGFPGSTSVKKGTFPPEVSMERSYDKMVKNSPETLYERKIAENEAATSRKYVANKIIAKADMSKSESDILESMPRVEFSYDKPSKVSSSCEHIMENNIDASSRQNFVGKSEEHSRENTATEIINNIPNGTPEFQEELPTNVRSRFEALHDRITEKKITREGNDSMNSADVSQGNKDFDSSFASNSTSRDKAVFETVYERKISEANAAASRKYSPTREKRTSDEDRINRENSQSKDPISSSSQSKEASLSKSSLHIMFSDSARPFSEILDFLRSHCSDPPATIASALGSLRDSLAIEYELSGNSVLSEGKLKSRFSKIIIQIMQVNSLSDIVQLEALRTIWTILAFSGRCISEFMSHPDGINSIIKAMKNHRLSEQIQECGLGIMSCIATIQKYAIRLARSFGGSVMSQLVDSLSYPCKSGSIQILTLNALFRISSAFISASSLGIFVDRMHQYFAQIKKEKMNHPTIAIDIITETMSTHRTVSALNVVGCRLLWNIFIPAPLDACDETLEAYSNSVNKLVSYLHTVSQKHKENLSLHETMVCLLSKISCYDGSMLTEVEPFVVLVIKIMSRHDNSWIIALHGCQCLRNICTRELTASIARPKIEACDGAKVITSCMNQFSRNHQVQSEACAALAAISMSSVPNKKAVLKCGGIEQILKAYDSYLISPYDEFSLNTKLQACITLTVLTTESTCLDALVKGGVVSIMEDISNESDGNLPESLAQAIENFLGAVSRGRNNTFSAELTDSADKESVFQWLMNEFQALAEIDDIGVSRSVRLRSEALRAMKKFPNDANIQEVGCMIFAHVCQFNRVQKPDQLEDEINTITECLQRYQSTNTIAISACSALKNLCIDSKFSKSVSTALSISATKVFNTLQAIHGNSVPLLMECAGVLWALGNIGVQFSFETEKITALLMKFATGYLKGSHHALQKLLIGAIWSILHSQDSDLDQTGDLVDLVVNVMTGIDEEEFFEVAINFLFDISRQGYKSILVLAEHESLIEIVVGNMFKYPESSSIQGTICNVISNIASNSAMDNGIRAEICSLGGVNQMLLYLENFLDDRLFIGRAFASLSAIMSGADVQVLHGNGAISCIMSVMSSHTDDVYVQIKGTAALWYLAAREDDFKHKIVQNGGAKLITNSMSRFISSEKMQEKGIITLWSLSTPLQLRSEIGHLAVIPILRGMQAHVTGHKVVEDGLSALKALSTHSSSKKILQENDAIDLILDSMWIHSESPIIQQIALGALSNISVDVDANTVTQITENDLSAIVTAMQLHDLDRGVQESALILLKNYSFSPNNHSVLRQHRFLSSLIRSASARFSDTFSGRSDFLIGILS